VWREVGVGTPATTAGLLLRVPDEAGPVHDAATSAVTATTGRKRAMQAWVELIGVRASLSAEEIVVRDGRNLRRVER